MASVLVICASSIHIPIIQAKSKQAQELLESLGKRTTDPISVRGSAASAVPPLSAFPAGPPHSDEGRRTPAPPAELFDIPFPVCHGGISPLFVSGFGMLPTSIFRV